MKLTLYSISGLIFFGCFFSWVYTGVNPDRPAYEILRSLLVSIAVILFCAGAIIGAVERVAAKNGSVAVQSREGWQS